MKIIGVTGGIGSGKSTVCHLFELFGIPVYLADKQAKLLCDSHPVIREQVTELFGSNAYVNNQYNRQWIGSQVFNHPDLLKKLNAIIHPIVSFDFDEWCHLHTHQPMVIKEAAILFESGAYQSVDSIITVTAPVDLRVKRVMKRDGLKEDQVLARINNQWTDDMKIERSQFVIVCDETQLVISQVINIYQQLV